MKLSRDSSLSSSCHKTASLARQTDSFQQRAHLEDDGTVRHTRWLTLACVKNLFLHLSLFRCVFVFCCFVRADGENQRGDTAVYRVCLSQMTGLNMLLEYFQVNQTSKISSPHLCQAKIELLAHFCHQGALNMKLKITLVS